MLKVKDIMTSPVYSLKETDSLYNARALMDLHRIRHIPIVTLDNEFAGLLTQRDILSATISRLAELDEETQKEIDSGIPIHEIMRVDIATVEDTTPLKTAAETLLNNKYGCLPVINQGTLVGIVTEADFLRLTISLIDSLENNN